MINRTKENSDFVMLTSIGSIGDIQPNMANMVLTSLSLLVQFVKASLVVVM